MAGKEQQMDARLGVLAKRLEACRKRGNRMTLQNVLESARILEQAKAIAKDDFQKWVVEEGRMDPTTARHHMRVAKMAKEHRYFNTAFATLSLTKLYALSGLWEDSLREVMSGEVKFSKPIEGLSDVQFLSEFRQQFTLRIKKINRGHMYREVTAKITRLEKAFRRGRKLLGRLKPDFKLKLAERLDALIMTATEWRAVARATAAEALAQRSPVPPSPNGNGSAADRATAASRSRASSSTEKRGS